MCRGMAGIVPIPVFVVQSGTSRQFIVFDQRQKLRFVAADHADFRSIVIFIIVGACRSLRISLRTAFGSAFSATVAAPFTAPSTSTATAAARTLALLSLTAGSGPTLRALFAGALVRFRFVVAPGVVLLIAGRSLAARRFLRRPLIPMIEDVIDGVLCGLEPWFTRPNIARPALSLRFVAPFARSVVASPPFAAPPTASTLAAGPVFTTAL